MISGCCYDQVRTDGGKQTQSLSIFFVRNKNIPCVVLISDYYCDEVMMSCHVSCHLSHVMMNEGRELGIVSDVFSFLKTAAARSFLMSRSRDILADRNITTNHPYKIEVVAGFKLQSFQSKQIRVKVNIFI